MKLLLGALVIVLIAFIYFYKFQTPASVPTIVTPATEASVHVPSIFDPLFNEASNILYPYSKNNPNNSVVKVDDSWVWWITPDNLNIINENSPEVALRLACQNNEEQLAEAMESLVPELDKILISEGYTLNQKNSSSSYKDEKFYDYVKAYEKEGVKCLIIANPDCVSSSGVEIFHKDLKLICTDKYDQNLKAQQPLQKDLKIKNSVVTIREQVGDYVLLDQHYRRTGNYIVAKKENGKWIELVSGEQAPDCAKVKKYQIPSKIIPTCYQDDKEIPNTF